MMLQILPGTSSGILFSCATSEAMKEVKPFQKSTAMGFFQATYAVGMSIFPMIVGKISGLISIRASYLVLSLISVIGIIASYFYYKKSVLVPIKSKNNYRLN